MYRFKCEVLENDGVTVAELELYAASPEDAAKDCMKFLDHTRVYRPMVPKVTVKVTGICHKYEGSFGFAYQMAKFNYLSFI